MSFRDPRVIRRSKLWDRLARWVITFGGVIVIASVIAILLLIVGVTLPLFFPPRASLYAKTPLENSPKKARSIAVGVRLDLDEHDQIKSLSGELLDQDGAISFFDFTALALAQTDSEAPSMAVHQGYHAAQPVLLGRDKIAAPGGENAFIKSWERHEGSKYSLLWSDGAVSLVDVISSTEFDQQGRRSVKYQAVTRVSVPAEKDAPLPQKALMRYVKDDDGSTKLTCVRLLPENQLVVTRAAKTVNELLGSEEEQTHREELEDPLPGEIGALTLDSSGTTLYAGTENGCLLRWRFNDKGEAVFHESLRAFRDQRPITALAMVYGDASLSVGDAQGGLSIWTEVRDADNKRHFRQIHTLAPHDAAVVEIVPLPLKKILLSRGAKGSLHVNYPTSESTLLEFPANKSLAAVGADARGRALAMLDDQGRIQIWRTEIKYPEVSLRTLFGKVFYEGYDAPAYAWQTTGSQDAEAKLSLMPLIFGTLKGTAYAMLFAVPLALFAAAYTSHFTTLRWKKIIKPVVEIMAALPSVVIGFLAALWFAPLLERWILGVFASLACLPLVFLMFMGIWQLLRKYDWAKRVEHGYEFLLMLPVIVSGAALGMYLVSASMRNTFGGNLETWFFGGNFRLWLNSALEMPYDQRNCVVIAFGLGFAVIPIIFSIAEDSLSNVPHSLTAASMAMGASRWQTLWRIVLPSASPGIFAGAMIGFGRAVGETMIVLMATGNTPILDWSPFNGMRTLSANIAVEIPEAPVGGILYRVLFLCAVILFLMTFMLNTAADLVRTRLRKRYGQF